MDVVIPQNLKQGIELYNYFKSLNEQELLSLINLYKLNGYEVKPRLIGSPRAEYFEISKNNGWSDHASVFISDDQIRFTKNGVSHKIGGPAEEWTDGQKNYFAHGELHREDGPAIVNKDGKIGNDEWYFNGHTLLKISLRFLLKTERKEVRDLYGVVRFLRNKMNLSESDLKMISKESVLSLIEFLWENGYQFDNYLPGSLEKTNDDFISSMVLEYLESREISEEDLLSVLEKFYNSHILAKHLKFLIEKLKEENDKSAISELGKNIKLMWTSFVNIDTDFDTNLWQSNDELTEAMSLKSYWSVLIRD